MKTQDFIKEIEGYSLDDLTLIFETQKDLYSEEEMEIIHQRIHKLEQEKQAEINAWIEKNIPKEIICPKCDGPNPFENTHCAFCGSVFDKRKYYDPDYYLPEDTDTVENTSNATSGRGYGFQYFISFLIPLIGFILGAILLSKDDDEERHVGKTCIILGIVSILICSLVVGAIL